MQVQLFTSLYIFVQQTSTILQSLQQNNTRQHDFQLRCILQKRLCLSFQHYDVIGLTTCFQSFFCCCCWVWMHDCMPACIIKMLLLLKKQQKCMRTVQEFSTFFHCSYIEMKARVVFKAVNELPSCVLLLHMPTIFCSVVLICFVVCMYSRQQQL